MRTVPASGPQTVRYLLADHLGSTAAVVDSTGALLSKRVYWPYGNERSLAGDALLTDCWFTGQRDESFDGLGLYHYEARTMSTVSGRFLSPDSIVPDPINPQSLNRYSYVLNNPLRYTDPTGLAPCPQGYGLPCPGDTQLGHCLLGLGCSVVAPNIPREWGLSFICQRYGTCLPGEQACTEFSCLVAPARAFGEVIVSVAPGSGDVLDACMFLTGLDCLRFESVPTWQRLLAAGSFFSPVGFGRYADEAGGALRINAHGLGKAGEAQVGAYYRLGKNRYTFSLPGGTRDFVDPVHRLIIESKNVRYLADTPQIRNYIALAEDLRYTLVIAVRKGEGTTIAPRLLELERGGHIEIRRIID